MARIRRTEVVAPPPKKKLRRGVGNRAGIQIKPADAAAALARKQRAERVCDLVNQGLTWRQIAREIGGITVTTVRDDFYKVLRELPSETVEEIRYREDARLAQQYQRALGVQNLTMRRLTAAGDDKGNLTLTHDEHAKLTAAFNQSTREIVRVSQSLRRLHGADAPAKVDVEHSGEVMHGYEVVVSLEELVRVGAENAGEPAPALLLNGKGPEDEGEGHLQ